LRGVPGGRNHVDAMAVLVEQDFSLHECEKGPVTAGADVVARDKFASALADQDAAGADDLASKPFHAEPFADAVATVADTALTFLMCHKSYPLMLVILTRVSS